VGKRRLEEAIKRVGESDDPIAVDVEWKPFQLNPRASKTGTNKLEMYKKKFGAERVSKMLPHMIEVGRQTGIEFSYGGDTGNTFDSHRLILLAWKEGGQELQDRVVEELFSNYFEQEKFIGDMAVLEECAAKCGVAGFGQIKSDPDFLTDETMAEISAYSRNVSGVPHFIVQDRHSLSGAQEADAFEEIFRKVAR